MRIFHARVHIWLVLVALGCLVRRGDADAPLSPGALASDAGAALAQFDHGARPIKMMAMDVESSTFDALKSDLAADLMYGCASPLEKPWANGFWKATGTSVTQLVERHINLNEYVRLVSDALNVGKAPTFGDVYNVLRGGFITPFFLTAVVVTLILMLLYMFAQVRCCRSCWSFFFCRVFCYDTQRLPLKELSTWRKIVATVLFVLFGVGVFWLATIFIARGMTFFGQAIQDMNCQAANFVNTLAFGGSTVLPGAKRTAAEWSGLKYFNNAIGEFKKSGVQGVVNNINGKFREAELQHYDKIKEAIEKSQNGIEIVSKAAKDASFIYIGGDQYAKSLSTFRNTIDNFHNNWATRSLPAPSLKSSNDLIQRLETVQTLFSQSAERLKDVYASWKVATAKLGQYIIPTTVVVLCVLGAVAFIGWIIASLWARVWRRERIPSHGLKAGTTGSYILYGVAAFISIIFSFLLFVLILVPAGTCGTQRDPIIKTVINSPLVSSDIRPILRECMEPHGGDLSKVFLNEDISSGGFADLSLYEKWETQLKEQLLIVKSAYQKILGDNKLLNLVIYKGTAPQVVGIQDPAITINCIKGLEALCSGGRKLTVQGAKFVESTINKILERSLPATTGATNTVNGVCITNAKECEDKQKIPIATVTSTSFNSAASSNPILQSWITVGQRIASLRWKVLTNCPDQNSSTECTIDSLLSLSDPAEKSLISPVTQAVNDALEGPSGVGSFTKEIRKYIPAFNGLNCAPIKEAAVNVLEAFCEDTGSVLGIVLLGFFLQWIGFLFLMVFMFTLWHYAHNLLFIAPKYDGVTPSQVIIEVTDPEYTRGHLIQPH